MDEYDIEIVADVAFDITDVDMLVLCIISSRDNKATLRTRLQRESLIYNMVYGNPKSPDPYYSGGYSDDIDESSQNIADFGLLLETSNGFKVTRFGSAVTEYKKSNGHSEMYDRVRRLNKSLDSIDDKSLVAITYELFPEFTSNSTIQQSMNFLLANMYLNGKHISEWTYMEFINEIAKGTSFSITRN